MPPELVAVAQAAFGQFDRLALAEGDFRRQRARHRGTQARIYLVLKHLIGGSAAPLPLDAALVIVIDQAADCRAEAIPRARPGDWIAPDVLGFLVGAIRAGVTGER